MAIQKAKLALTLLLIYLIAIVPAFFITGSVAETLCFFVVMAVAFPIETKLAAGVAFSYFNPLKIVDGRYGMSGAWIGASPVGLMLGYGAVSLLSSINSSCGGVLHGC